MHSVLPGRARPCVSRGRSPGFSGGSYEAFCNVSFEVSEAVPAQCRHACEEFPRYPDEGWYSAVIAIILYSRSKARVAPLEAKLSWPEWVDFVRMHGL